MKKTCLIKTSKWNYLNTKKMIKVKEIVALKTIKKVAVLIEAMIKITQMINFILEDHLI